MELHTIGIDLGKTVFHLVGFNVRGEVVVHKKFSRTQRLRFSANIHVQLIGMEACGGASACPAHRSKTGFPSTMTATVAPTSPRRAKFSANPHDGAYHGYWAAPSLMVGYK